MNTIKLWHGSQRWDGPPRLNPSRPGCYECGPGLYLTTKLSTARKYSKGAGKTVLVELDPDLCLLEDATLTLAEMKEAVAALPRVRNRQRLIDDLENSATRHPDGNLPAVYLVNLCVNNQALPGQSGPVLAKWLASHGIDASLTTAHGHEQWMVVFNLDKIRRSRPMSSNDAYDIGDQPFVQEQMDLPCVDGSGQEAPKTRRPGP